MAQDQGNFLYLSLPPLSSWLLVGSCLQHPHHLLPDIRNQVVVSGQLGDAALGLSETRSMQLGGLGLNLGLVLKWKRGSFSP